MTITLFELTGADDRRFSPYCWRARMALAHKGLWRDCVTVPVGFTEKDKISFSDQKLVPILDNDGTIVTDSWAIACYLEDHFPDAPSQFGGIAGRGMAHLIAKWVETGVQPLLTPMIVADIWAHTRPEDRDYFRETREKRFGNALETVQSGREERLAGFQASLEPARTVLRERDFIGGDEATFADYILFGIFQWARMTSRFELLAADDPVHTWRERMLDLFDGLGRLAPVPSK
ncbi:MAG: glutathione S-transferase family protein [Rhodospirillaceae bacterium]|nr:glutathione S-transferase family protein [Rhodospirillaceae bacterium]